MLENQQTEFLYEYKHRVTATHLPVSQKNSTAVESVILVALSQLCLKKTHGTNLCIFFMCSLLKHMKRMCNAGSCVGPSMCMFYLQSH